MASNESSDYADKHNSPVVADFETTRHTSNTSSVDVDEHSHLTLFQAIKKWKRVFWYSLAISSTILMFGYDYVIVGNSSSMPAFQHDFGQYYEEHWIIPSLWLGLWTFISPGGMMIGSLFVGYFQDWSGRKASFFVSSILAAVAVAVCFCSQYPHEIGHRRGTFLAGKGVQGIALGMMMTTCQTYLSEIAPPKLRGPLLAFFPIFTLVGQLIGALVIYGLVSSPNGYAIAFATQWIFAAIALAVSFIIPESPIYLIRKGQIEKARAAQRRLAGEGSDPDRILAILERDIEHETRQTPATMAACFSKIQRRRTMVVLFTSVLPQAFGLTLLSQASYFGQVVGIEAKISLVLLIAGVLTGCIANIISMWSMSRFGHRTLSLTGLVVCGFLWLSMGIAGSIAHNMAVAWFCSAVLILVTAFGGLTVWPASYTIGSEVSTLHLRAKAQGAGWLFSSAFSAGFGLGLPYIYNPDAGNLRAMVGYIFAAFCFISLMVTWLYVPEMKGRTASEIDRMFDLGLKTREFKHWRADSGLEPKGYTTSRAV
ncbi:sugar transporter, putative [Cordyceps militaris CM01]|uniref:Sugar transporter, putative n=1 Tax=Cordyceps militaris (strain CM01) TaxID=983644 RepID=G3JCK2_CORMM|nr:sugar transporter, putative [Cordyceps militaris CM01]EGX93814.1 sugar transporter, putative [Cordyceps militaris CM01]